MSDFTTLEAFREELFSHNPGQMEERSGQGQELLQGFDINFSDLTSGLNDMPACMHGALQIYFFLYLWGLKSIDDQFIHAVSQDSAADPQAYEKIKNHFLGVIHALPVDMIAVFVQYYNEKIQSLEKKNIKSQEGQTLKEEDFSLSVIQLITNVKAMMEGSLQPNIEKRFEKEKDFLLKGLSKALNMAESDETLQDIVKKMNTIYRGWTEDKERRYDEQGRCLMTFLTASVTSDAHVIEPISDDIFMEIVNRPHGFMPQYDDRSQTGRLPLQMIVEIQKIMHDVPILTEEQKNRLLMQQPLCAKTLKIYIDILDQANRLVFAIQQLSTITPDMLKRKK